MQVSYTFSTDKSKLDIEYICHYLREESYWAKGRPVEVIKRSIEHSFAFGVYQENQQVGFARVITDCAVFAYIADVFIDEKHRGQGLSKQLMQTILYYPEFRHVTQWSLKTLDAHGLYAQFNFAPPKEPARIMEWRKD